MTDLSGLFAPNDVGQRVTAGTWIKPGSVGASDGLVQLIPQTTSFTGGSGSVSSVGEMSFTGCNSISFDVFDQFFDSYFIVARVASTGTGAGVYWYLSDSSGTTNNIFDQYLYASGSTFATSPLSIQQSFSYIASVGLDPTGFTHTIWNPWRGYRSWAPFISRSCSAVSSGTPYYMYDLVAAETMKRQWTRITYASDSSNTLSGVMTVFGYVQK